MSAMTKREHNEKLAELLWDYGMAGDMKEARHVVQILFAPWRDEYVASINSPKATA